MKKCESRWSVLKAEMIGQRCSKNSTFVAYSFFYPKNGIFPHDCTFFITPQISQITPQIFAERPFAIAAFSSAGSAGTPFVLVT
jgi:hypothetical protein